MEKMKLDIKGMHCASCEITIGNCLNQIPGVEKVEVSKKNNSAEIFFNNKPDLSEIKTAIEKAGYELGISQKPPLISSQKQDYFNLLKAGIILAIVYAIAKISGLSGITVSTSGGGIFIALLVGLIAGVSSCMALVGGLVLSLSARYADLHPEASAINKFKPHLYFNIGRIVSYTALGGVIGIAGSAFKMSSNLVGIITIFLGFVMIFFGLKLIEIFPALKDRNIALPAALAKLFGLNKKITVYDRKSAVFLGALTFFVPCGFTQAMQLFAISTGSFYKGMAIMGLFALGTTPGLLSIGGLTSLLSGKKSKIFFATAGLAVLIMGIFNIASGSNLIGFKSNMNGVVTQNVEEIRMVQNGNGYFPSQFTVKKGQTVKWIIDSKSSYSCASTIVMPKLGIDKNLQPGENEITFTPTASGELPFSCSMGMYRGKFIVE